MAKSHRKIRDRAVEDTIAATRLPEAQAAERWNRPAPRREPPQRNARSQATSTARAGQAPPPRLRRIRPAAASRRNPAA